VSTESPPTGIDLNVKMQRYEAAGYSRARILAQLIADGIAPEQLTAHFPDFPPEAFARATLPGPRAVTVSLPAKSPTSTPAREFTVPSPAGSTTENRAAQVFASSVQAVEEGISFHYVPLIQCSFPHADPGQAVTFSRQNGWLELTLGTTRPEAGLPYGVPARLLTIYCASEAIRTRSPDIYLGRSVHDFLRLLDVPITRGDRGSLRVYANQLLRLIHSTLSIDENIRDASGRSGLHLRQALFAEEAQLWWDDEHHVGQGSSLTLSSVLFTSILERSAPLATHAIKQLRKSPMDLDVYAWLVHRLFHLGKPSLVTWAQLSGQFGHGYAELRKFRRFFMDSLQRVQQVYTDAKLRTDDRGVLLLPSKPHVTPSRITGKSRS